MFDPSGGWRKVVPALRHVDVFMPGLAEAQAITGETEPAAVAAELRRQGVAEVALKLGERGCYAAGERFEGFVEPHRVRTVDGMGSG